MSKSVGIVAEYNPFHTGHKYQIDYLKKAGFETVVCAMSGSCVQRGALAFMSKFDRAGFAVENGADLVVEIPFPFSCLSAEGFAASGVMTLKNLGVDALCFGSECADEKLLYDIAAYLLTDEYKQRLRQALTQKIPYATAREQAIFSKFDLNKETLSASNDILAIEYIKACIQMGWNVQLIALKRQGAVYNRTVPKNGYASASTVRKMVGEFRFDAASEFIPKASKKSFDEALSYGRYFTGDSAFEKSLLFALRQKSSADFIKIRDCNKELSHALEKAAAQSDSIESFFRLLPTKMYTRARIKRIILHAFLNLEDNFPDSIQYIRLLGMSEAGEAFLKQVKACPLPISHSPKILSRKSEDCARIIAAESAATDAQASFCKIIQPRRTDFTRKLFKRK